MFPHGAPQRLRGTAEEARDASAGSTATAVPPRGPRARGALGAGLAPRGEREAVVVIERTRVRPRAGAAAGPGRAGAAAAREVAGRIAVVVVLPEKQTARVGGMMVVVITTRRLVAEGRGAVLDPPRDPRGGIAADAGGFLERARGGEGVVLRVGGVLGRVRGRAAEVADCLLYTSPSQRD